MPQKKDTSKEASTSPHATAPELPAHIAKEFGLHHSEGATTRAKPAADGTHTSLASIPEAMTDDPKTDKAVEDIQAEESDQLLNSQNPATHLQPPRRSFWKKIGHFFARWWGNKKARWATIIIVVLGSGVLVTIPTTRYGILNTVGVRSSASVVVLDETTGLPLKNVTVRLGPATAETTIEGKARLSGLRLGSQKLTIERIAFAPHSESVTLGWGSNPLGEYKLTAVGVQYELHVSDFLSGKPIEGVEAVSDQANALSDRKGKILITVEETDETTLEVTVGGAGYRKQTLKLNAAATSPARMRLVPDQKEVFISRESGKYDVYSIDLDGKNRKLLLAGTGNENGDTLQLVVSPDSKRAALVSTRDNVRDEDGYLLQSLTIIDVASGTSATVDHAQQIQLIDWAGERFVYRSTIAGPSGVTPQRNRLISYSFKENARIQLVTANQFTTVFSVRGKVYYSMSTTDPNAPAGLFVIKPDGKGRTRLSTQELWAGIRSAHDQFTLQTPGGWYTFDVSSEELTKTTPPAQIKSYLFADDLEAKRTVWSDTRDGKGVLLMRTGNTQPMVLVTQSGLTSSVRWAGDKAIIYRVVAPGDSSSYVVSPDGGAARKITGVTATYGYALPY